MIYNDLEKSNYTSSYGKLTLYFSSEFYKRKFDSSYNEFLNQETLKLKIKFKCEVNFEYMILLLLYQKIEKRGFKVIYNGYEVDKNYCISEKLNYLD